MSRPLAAAALAALLSTAGCRTHDPLFCDQTHPCTDPARPYCDLQGIYPGSDGHGKSCVPNPFDAEVAADAPAPVDGTADGATDAEVAVDARPPDAAPDAPPGPLVVTGQLPDLVLGKPDFTSEGNGPRSAIGLAAPWGVHSDGTRLWVGDSNGFRVLQWSSPPIVNQAAADIAIGQASLTSYMAGPTGSILGPASVTAPNLHGVAYDGTRVYVSDRLNHRVMIWNPVPTTSGASADSVLGQTSFLAGNPGTTASTLRYPTGVWSDGVRIAVADTFNNRVLIWSSVAGPAGRAADVVLGQPGFTTSTVVSPPTGSSMNGPTDVNFDGTRLFVSDTGNHRVMVWLGIPTTSGVPADYFVGQGGPTGGSPNAGGAGTNAAGLNGPEGVLVAFGSLFVADRGNHRVVVFTPVPAVSGASAAAALGQDNLTSNAYAPGVPTQDRIGAPTDVTVLGDKLFVADYEWDRVLRYDLDP